MKAARSATTAGAGTAGAALGSIAAWALGAITGHPLPGEVIGAFATLGAFVFGVYLPRPRGR